MARKKESLDEQRARMKKILAILGRTYAHAKCSLDYSTPFELLCATILSAQCTDERVNMVTPALFKKYPDARALAKAKQQDVEALIKSTGFYKNKATSLIACAAALVEKHRGEVPQDMDALVALRGVGRPLSVVVEIDSGEHRTGAEPAEAGEVAQAASAAGLDVRGLFTHGGHSYVEPGAAGGAAEDEVSSLDVAVASLREAGFEPGVVSAGSTPTATLSARGLVTEERPGTYIFGDRQQVALGGCRPDQVGLFVAATVVSVGSDSVVLDCGAKTLSKDRKDWMQGHGLIVGYPDLVIADLYDYHGVIRGPAKSDRPRLGEQVLVLPNHACPVVNLFPHIAVLEGGRVVDRWMVDAQARSS